MFAPGGTEDRAKTLSIMTKCSRKGAIQPALRALLQAGSSGTFWQSAGEAGSG